MSKVLKPLSSTYLFKSYDSTIHLQRKMIETLKGATVVKDDQIEDYLKSIERRYMDAMKNKVFEDYRNGTFKLIYNESDVRLPNSIPAFLINQQGVRCFVPITNHMKLDRNDRKTITIDPKVLYTLMSAGTFTALCYKQFNTIKNKTVIIKKGSAIYSELLTKVINKLLTLNINEAKVDLVTFMTSLFFIHNMLGRDEENYEEINERYAMENCTGAGRNLIEEIMCRYDCKKNMADFNSFINSLATIPGLEKLNTPLIISEYVLAYGSAMLMSLEYLPILMVNLQSVSIGAFLNSQLVLEKRTQGNLSPLIKEFSNL